ncbi:thiol-disulfide isomerase-like thioredoxin [Burkholderiales bacterium JOSHI_001]|nr:thiol-disulfide isomerase-like thioredoxin [Burkholderiales bacterium JOSHI_001]
MNRRNAALGLGVAAAAAGAGLATGWWRHRADAPEPAAASPVAAAAPAAVPGAPGASAAAGLGSDPLWGLSFERPGGGQLAMASLKGKPLVVNFWATWCAPCLKELPELDRFHAEYRAAGWTVLALAIDSPTPVREFLAKMPLKLEVALAGVDGFELVRTMGNDRGALPYSVVIAADGRVVQRKLGQTNFQELAGWAKQA